MKSAISTLINGISDKITTLRDKPELPKLNDMIEKLISTNIDELNSIIDKNKSKEAEEAYDKDMKKGSN